MSTLAAKSLSDLDAHLDGSEVREAQVVRAPSAASTRSIEERVSVLETRWEDTVPKLVTSAGLEELRSDIKSIRWVLGAVVAMLVGVLSLVFALHGSTNGRIDSTNERLDQTNIRIDQTNTRLDQMSVRLDQMNTRIDQMNTRIDQTNARLDQLQGEMNARFDQMNARMDARFDALMAEMRELRKERARD